MTADSFLQTPLQFLKGVGPRKAADLKRAGLQTVEDLFYRLPFRYEDRSRMQPIVSLRPGAKAAVLGEIKSARLSITRRRGFKIFNAVVSDASGAIRCTWMNQAFLADILQPHLQVVIFGDVRLDSTGLHFLNPEYELVTDDLSGVHTGRIVPFYEKTGSVTPNMQRKLVRSALDQLPDSVPDILTPALRARLQLLPRRAAIEASHFPPNEASVEALNAFRTPAQRRLIFEEFFLFQIGYAWRRHATGTEVKPFVPTVDDRIRAAAAKILPFKLTPGQRQAIKEIVDDMQQPPPMHRLLQGDVGAGKTIVALLAALVAMENGLQVAFMAPTEILASQHYATIARLLAASRFRVDLLTGSTPGLQKHTLHAHIERGTSNLIVGTHALVQEGIRFHTLGLVVIDEQHRFGVVQRAALRAKGLRPDVLLMTATPIPRTLALTYYGDLDVVVLDEMPAGREPVETRIARTAPEREAAYALVRREIEAGHQAFVVCAAIDEANKTEVRAAEAEAARLATDVFPDLSVELLHGRMRPAEKERRMDAFRSGEHHLLISTTVIEVGVDVPNATVMLVENAERFGLAQLHQLRGRIGRGAHRSYCVLFDESKEDNEEARRRLEAMVATTDGFALADEDLRLRGEGTLFDVRQSGLPDLKLARLADDADLVRRARARAFEVIERDPQLRDDPALLQELRGRFERSIDWLFNT